MLDHWDRAGDSTQQWLNLRYVARLLHRVGAGSDAATLHGFLVAAGKPSPLDRPGSTPARPGRRLGCGRGRGGRARQGALPAWMRPAWVSPAWDEAPHGMSLGLHEAASRLQTHCNGPGAPSSHRGSTARHDEEAPP